MQKLIANTGSNIKTGKYTLQFQNFTATVYGMTYILQFKINTIKATNHKFQHKTAQLILRQKLKSSKIFSPKVELNQHDKYLINAIQMLIIICLNLFQTQPIITNSEYFLGSKRVVLIEKKSII